MQIQSIPSPADGRGQGEGGYNYAFPPHLNPLPSGERKARGFIV